MPDRAYDFSIKIGGLDIGDTAKRHIVSLTYEENLEETAQLEFALRSSEFFVFAGLDLRLGTKVELHMGLIGDLVRVFEGEIAKLSPVFPEDDSSHLKIICYDDSYKLKRRSKPKVFAPDEYPDLESIARWIINKHKLEPIIGVTVPVGPPSESDLAKCKIPEDRSFPQEDETDWQMLAELAEIVNYNLFVKFGHVFLVPDSFFKSAEFHELMDESRPFTPLRLVYYSTTDDLGDRNMAILQTFEPEVSSDDQRISVEVISWDSINEKGERFGKASLSQLDHKDEAYTEITVSTQAIETLTIHEAAGSLSEARYLARRELARRAARLVKGEGVLANGNPFIRMGQTHEIVLRDLGPIGKQFSGEYLITAVRHEIDEEGMCRTSFDVRRDGLTKA